MAHSLTMHHTAELNADISLPDPHQDTFSKTLLGFWIYLMTDCILFATLFITYAVLHLNTFGGPSSKELFNLSTAFTETMLLLISSVTCGFAIWAATKSKIEYIALWLFVTFLLGASFLAIELTEFTQLIEEGNSFTRSAFLSSFFTLVGTHGLHITTGLFWVTVLLFQLYFQGLTTDTFRRLMVFSLFWHFLDLIWIFIFTIVYLMGVI